MKKYRATIYLGGSIDGQKYEDIMKTRSEVKRLLQRKGFKVLCPMRGKQELKHKVITRDNAKEIYKSWGFIDRDLADLRKSNCLLILTGDIPTDGTWLEYGFFLWKLQRPIVMIAPSRVGADKFGWSNRYASYIAMNIKDAVNWMDKFLFYKED